MSQFKPPSQPGWNYSESEQPQQEFPQQQVPRPFIQQLQPPQQTAWQEPQYPPQPETYYPPQQPMLPVPPPKKRMRRNDKIALSIIASMIGVVVLIVLSLVVFSGSGTSAAPSLSLADQHATANAAQTDTANSNMLATADANMNALATTDANSLATSISQPTTVPTPQPSPTPQNDLGSSQSSGSWSITINSVKPTVSNNEFEVPKAGNQFVLINFTALNTDSAAHDMNPFYFTLRDDSGTSYDIAVVDTARSADGTVVSGQKLRGDLPYELPKTLHSFTLQFDAPEDFDHSQVVQWQLSV